MDGDRAGVAHRVGLALEEVDAVAEERPGSPSRYVAGVDIGVIDRFRIELAGVFDFVVVFRKMRLDMQVGESSRRRAPASPPAARASR